VLLLGLLALAAGRAVLPAAHASQAAAQPDNVILVCSDGLDRSVFSELLDAGQLPDLAELAERGSVQEIDVVWARDLRQARACRDADRSRRRDHGRPRQRPV
jgi:hypothetical protein